MKDTLRTIKNTLSRFLAIIAMTGLSAMVFIGLQSGVPNLEKIITTRVKKHQIHDLRVHSYLGIRDEDKKILEEIPGQNTFEYSSQEVFDVAGKDFAINLISSTETIDLAFVDKGRLPQKSGEILLDSKYLEDYGDQIGQSISFVNKKEKDDNDMLRTETFSIVGYGKALDYIAQSRSGSTSSGDYFAYIYKDDLIKEYPDFALGRLESNKDMDITSKKFKQFESKNIQEIKDLFENRPKELKQELLKDAYKKIDDGKKEIADGKKKLSDAELDLKDAKKKLDDAKIEIDDGYKKLEDTKKELNSGYKKLEDSKIELDNSKTLLDQSLGQINLGSSELEANQSTFMQKIQDSSLTLSEKQAQIDKGISELEKAKAQYQAGLKEYQEKITQGQAQLDATKAQLDQSKAKIESGLNEVNAGLNDINSKLEAIDTKISEIDQLISQNPANLQELQAQKAQLVLQKTQLEGVKSELTAKKDQVDQAQAKYQAGLLEYEKALKSFNQEKQAGKAKLDQAKTKIDASTKELEAAKAQIAQGQNRLMQEKTSGQNRLNQAQSDLASARAQYEDGLRKYQDGLALYNSSKKKLDDGKAKYDKGILDIKKAQEDYDKGLKEYQDGLKKFEDEKIKANQDIKKAEYEIKDTEERLKSLNIPAYKIEGIYNNLAFSGYMDQTHSLNIMSYIFTGMFYLVAILVTLTTILRMVETERTQIGTLKALGYSRRKILGKFLIYGLIAALVGSLLGILIGHYLLMPPIVNAYISSTNLEKYTDLFNYIKPLVITLASFLVIGATIFFSVMDSLNEEAANLMRPKPPKDVKRTLLERIPFIWNKLSFLNKVSIRNVVRNKLRVFMIILGVAGSFGLIAMGFGIQDSVRNVGPRQFGGVYKYHAQLVFNDEADDYKTWYQTLEDKVSDQISVITDEGSIVNKEGFNEDLSILATDDPKKLLDFVELRKRSTDKNFLLEDGKVIISEKLALSLGLSKGDDFKFIDSDGMEHSLEVQEISEQYFNHACYMTKKTFNEFVNSKKEMNSLLVKFENSSKEDIGKIKTELSNYDANLAFVPISDLETVLNNLSDSLDIVILLIIAVSALLTFVVLYNLTNINISERFREIATIKVLGFKPKEVMAYIFKENYILTFIGILVGIGLAKMMHSIIVFSLSSGSFLFDPAMSARSFIYAGLAVIFFMGLVMMLAMKDMSDIDMVEALKSVD